MNESATEKSALRAALLWHIEAGADEALSDKPGVAAAPVISRQSIAPKSEPRISAPTLNAGQDIKGSSEARLEAIRLATAAEDLESLAKTIADFDGLAIKKTATKLVFADGNPRAALMIIGDAPGAEDDRQGSPFSGTGGQLLDLMLEAIGLGRQADKDADGAYVTNIVNWRPPGNRTPVEAEIAVSLPFIEKHIALVRPKILLLAGGVAASALLRNSAGISRLRGRLQDYRPATPELAAAGQDAPIPALATYPPSYLLATPSQKRLAWQDMLIVRRFLNDHIKDESSSSKSR